MSGLDWLDDGPDEWTRRYVESVWADCPISAILVLLAMLLAPWCGSCLLPSHRRKG